MTFEVFEVNSSMKIDFFDINKVHGPNQLKLEEQLIMAFRRGDYINGKRIGILENQLAEYLNIPHCISCANGTDALTLALRCLGLPDGSEVIIPSFNYVSAAETATNLGLKVVFCDVEMDSFNTSLALLLPHITHQTKAIVVTHLFGKGIGEMQEIAQYCQTHGIKLIEDNAQSFGVSINGLKAGTFGDLSTTSFFPTKNLGCAGDGGAVFTKNDQYAANIRMLKSHGQSEKYKFEQTGYNSRLDTLQAEILIQKLTWLDDSLAKRSTNAQHYHSELSNLKEVQLPGFTHHSFNQFTLQVAQKNRDALRDTLQTKGIGTMLYYPIALHRQACFKDLEHAALPNSEELCKTCFSLPIHSGLGASEISYICSEIKRFYD